MESTVKIQNSEMPLVLQKATVIHANKYSKATGAFSYFVFSSLHTEAVFRLDGSNDDVQMHFKNVDLPLYVGEAVYLIRVNGTVVGYIDIKSKRYYYISNYLGKDLRLQIPFYHVWIFGILGGLIIGFIEGGLTVLIFTPLFFGWLFYLIYSTILSNKIKRTIDRVLT